jgi:hypothetical protein
VTARLPKALGREIKESILDGREVENFQGFVCMKALLLVLLLLWAGSVLAQDAPTPMPEANSPVTAVFSTSTTEPLLGEAFEISITINAPAGAEILSWPSFEMPMERLEEGEIISANHGATVQYTRTYKVVMWEVGEHLSAGTLLEYRFNGGRSAVPISSFFIQVPSQVENAETATLRPSIAPVDLPYTSPYSYIGIAAGIILLLLIVARLLQVSRRGMVRIVAASPLEKALAELEDLKNQNLPPATIYAMVADFMRHYLEGRFGIQAVEMTTGELSEALRGTNLLPKEQERRLQQILEQADLIKFARFQPDEVTSKRLVNYAMKWLRETEKAS